MGFIDDVVVNAKSAAEMMGKTAGKIVDVSKLKINQAEVNADIKGAYEALGKYVYDNSRSAFSADMEISGMIAGIDALKIQAEAIKTELADKQNKVACPSCSKLSPIGVAFCSECGARIIAEDAAQEPAAAPAAEAPASEPVEQDTNE